MQRSQSSLEYIMILAGVIAIAVVIIIIASMLLAPSEDATIVASDKYAAGLIGVDLVGYTTPYDGTQETLVRKLSGNVDWSNYKGTQSGTSDTVLTDANASWTADEFIGFTIKNLTDGSSGTCTDNDATTITVDDLTGGSDDSWDPNDEYEIVTQDVSSARFQLQISSFHQSALA